MSEKMDQPALVKAAWERYNLALERGGSDDAAMLEVLAPLLQENARAASSQGGEVMSTYEQIRKAYHETEAQLREADMENITLRARVKELEGHLENEGDRWRGRVKQLEEQISRLRTFVDPIALKLFDQNEAQQ